MIGYRFPHNGAQVVAIAPADVDSYVVLCVARSQRKTEYITGKVAARIMPTPDEWWAGTYHDRLEVAVQTFIGRSMLAPPLRHPPTHPRLLRLVQTTIDTLAEKEKADA